jgi:hypothetical protein|tara:strand:+ start:81 stop:488 length:408 start_codon:yes stop_codon:yes gene_type:complete
LFLSLFAWKEIFMIDKNRIETHRVESIHISLDTTLNNKVPDSDNHRQRWADCWMRIFQRTVLIVVAKTIAPGIRIFKALAPTALLMEYAIEVANTAPLTRNMPCSDSETKTEPLSSDEEQPSNAARLHLPASAKR